MNNLSTSSHHEVTMLPTLEELSYKTTDVLAAHNSRQPRLRKQRVTITLPVSLLERLRNAVYWTGHGPLARLICDALDDAVTQMEAANGKTFPQRLAPLKRGRPRTKGRSQLPSPMAVSEQIQ